MAITASVADLREHFEAVLRRPLGHIPLHEWEAFRAANGPFTAEDYDRFPLLYWELVRDHGGTKRRTHPQ